MDEKDKIQKAWNNFQDKMLELKKKRHEILVRISEKLDKQHLAVIRKKMQNHE